MKSPEEDKLEFQACKELEALIIIRPPIGNVKNMVKWKGVVPPFWPSYEADPVVVLEESL